MKVFGEVLQDIFEDYKHAAKLNALSKSNPILAMADFFTNPDNVDKLLGCCHEHGFPQVAKKDIVDFIVALFIVDPSAMSFKYGNAQDNQAIEYQDPNAPYKYGLQDLDDSNDVVVNNTPIKIIDNSKPEDYKVRPKCPDCSKLGYFGLPFCPWCMKPLTSFYPELKANAKEVTASVKGNKLPILSMSMINTIKKKDKKVSMVIAGVKKTFNRSDVFVQDGPITITYGDIEKEGKELDKLKKKMGAAHYWQ